MRGFARRLEASKTRRCGEVRERDPAPRKRGRDVDEDDLTVNVGRPRPRRRRRQGSRSRPGQGQGQRQRQRFDGLSTASPQAACRTRRPAAADCVNRPGTSGGLCCTSACENKMSRPLPGT